ncbi:hypothetical protein M3P05_05055 [Sansalvadorimonas sp. 2012CJ34-2]|uniref:Uncharacterized protein n=1 Tax=Parendozoicomonas callyspongiae TaxID=2942213 RepID=A0ABT0PD51_9GAMM|nr:hypothetical protein [Sansalvadorimonas sp. 2012CJ34-2]MCL6269312.1 hypothetical protein [Sansalvadorimonas sp. 2012CJ34-2]
MATTSLLAGLLINEMTSQGLSVIMDFQLATCPYCGNRHPKLVHRLFGNRVICTKCHAVGPDRKSGDLARYDWNRQSRELAFEKSIKNQQLLAHLSRLSRLSR